MNHNPLLSVIIISHNQKDMLKRCVDSVLIQRTSFPVEIIISDDRSTDGTREMLQSDYSNNVVITYCNTDEYEPYYAFERAGYNRMNGLKIARGKYIIHIDGDDMFEGDNVFQNQVDILEKHPECSICVQNYKIVDISDIEHGDIALDRSIFLNNPIISAADFIKQVSYVPNSACCMRRTSLDQSLFIPLSGKTYDDWDITYRYLGYNQVALLDQADFKYIQHPNSFCHVNKSTDWSILAASGLQGIRYVPKLALPIVERHYNSIWALAKMAWKRTRVSDELIEYFNNDDMFIFKVFNNTYPLKDWIRVNLIILWLIPIRFMGIKSNVSWKILNKLAI